MLNFGLYAIETSDSERGSSVKELYTSFEECIEHRKEYADWYRNKGDISIIYYPANCKFSKAMYWDIRTDETGNWEISYFFNYSKVNPLSIGVTDKHYYEEMKKFVN